MPFPSLESAHPITEVVEYADGNGAHERDDWIVFQREELDRLTTVVIGKNICDDVAKIIGTFVPSKRLFRVVVKGFTAPVNPESIRNGTVREKSFSLYVCAEDTIARVKAKIFEKEAWAAVDEMRFIFNGRQLADHVHGNSCTTKYVRVLSCSCTTHYPTVSDYGIVRGATIHLVHNLRR